jgi:hypothetical protein
MTYLQHPHSIDPSSTSSFQADTDNMTSASTQSVDAIELLVLNFILFYFIFLFFIVIYDY